MEFHILCDPQDIAAYVFLPESHEHAMAIAAQLESGRFISDSRGYLVYSGTVDGIPMTVCSTAIGGPQLAIGVEELGHMGAKTFIRIGSCRAFQDAIIPGDLFIPTGVYRGGATGDRYLSKGFPAVPDFRVLSALAEEGRKTGPGFHVGLGWSGDAFYAAMPPDLLEKLKQSRVLSLDMETDTLYLISNFRGWRAGAILVCTAQAEQNEAVSKDGIQQEAEERAIQIAIRAMARIAQHDAQVESPSKPLPEGR